MRGGSAINAAALLATLVEHDIRISVDGEQLRCNAPVGALTDELREELQRRKDEIVQFLRSAGSLVRQQRAIVPLQPRGTHPPVFAFGGHNGDVFCFRALARHSGENQPLFGLQPPGLEDGQKPLDRVEDLATFFADEIRTFRPATPYIIAGFCAGGAIAFELARTLLEQGEPIALLALFGTPYPTSYRRLPRMRRWIVEQTQRLARHSRLLVSMPADERRSYIAGKLHRPKPLDLVGAPAPPSHLLARRASVQRATFVALRNYLPGHLAGRLVHFLPSKEWVNSPDQLMRWRSCARHAAEYYGPNGCGLDDMLLEPHARVFAELFAQARETPYPAAI